VYLEQGSVTEEEMLHYSPVKAFFIDNEKHVTETIRKL